MNPMVQNDRAAVGRCATVAFFPHPAERINFGFMTATVRRRKATPKRAGNGQQPARHPLAKAPTGIPGLDEITNGGLPRGRPTLVCGGAGCGKTLLAMEFLVRGALEYDEPGVFISFEETTDDLVENAQSLGFDVRRLSARRRLCSITCSSSAQSARRAANTISRDCSSG